MADKNISTVLGLDYGTKRIGIAVGQTLTRSASPLATLTPVNGSPDWDSIGKLIKQWAPDALVVGIPYYIDGTESNMTSQAKTFCQTLEKKYALPVFGINEALSSHSAEEYLKKNSKISKQNKHEVDKIAAAIIVQSWLDQQ